MRRFAGDVSAVIRHSEPASAAQWLSSLIVHLPECLRRRSLSPADRAWQSAGARFRTSSGTAVALPGPYTAGAREMYCRNVYLRTGLEMPSRGWVIDLGANSGLFSVWAACAGATVLAVEAQQGFATEICRLADHNGVCDRVNVETVTIGGQSIPGSTIGALADDERWKAASRSSAERSANVSVPELLARYSIDRIGLLKVDIEGGEFGVFAEGEDLSWLELVDQVVLELHPDFGDPTALVHRLSRHGLPADTRNNDGHLVTPDSTQLAYAYCSRSGRVTTPTSMT